MVKALAFSTMKTLVGEDGEPEGQPLPIDLAAKPIRDPENPDGPLIWGASLTLLYRIELTAETLPQLFELAQYQLELAYPSNAPDLRVLIVPDRPYAGPDYAPVVEISKFEVWTNPDDHH